MREKTQNYFLFVILFFLGLFQAVTGFVLWLALPHGGGGRGGSTATFWSLSRDTWVDFHGWVAVAAGGHDYHTPYIALEVDCLYDKIIF